MASKDKKDRFPIRWLAEEVKAFFCIGEYRNPVFPDARYIVSRYEKVKTFKSIFFGENNGPTIFPKLYTSIEEAIMMISLEDTETPILAIKPDSEFDRSWFAIHRSFKLNDIAKNFIVKRK